MMKITTSMKRAGRKVKWKVGPKAKPKGLLETARNMILEGLPISLVVKMTGLPEAEIIKLQQEN